MKSIIKNLILFVLALTLTFSFSACGSDSKETENNSFLTEGNWKCYDDDLGEDISIYFNENGEYFYSCACGEPVGNSDCYDKYEYDSTHKTIKLTGPDDEKMGIGVVYYDEYYLVLKFDDGVKVFKNQKSAINEIADESLVDMKNKPAAYLSILGYEDGKITLAPCNYDGDAKENFKNNIFEIEESDKAKYRSLHITIKNGKETKRDDFMLTDSEKASFGEAYHTGYVLFADDGKIENITFYGTLEITE